MLLLLIFGLVEFARAWNIRHVITDGAREAARYMAVRYDTVGANQAIAAAFGTAGLKTASATISFASVTTSSGDAGTEVSIEYPYTLGIVGRLLGWALPNRQLNINTAVTMRNE
jgi:Flp pilus assembly protein TadG